MNNNEKKDKYISDEWLTNIINEIANLERYKISSDNQIDIDAGYKPITVSEEEINNQIRALYIDLEHKVNIKEVNSDYSKEYIRITEVLELLKQYISKLNKERKKTNKIICKNIQKLISYITFMSVLISVPYSMSINSKEANKERLYKTDKEIVTSSTGKNIKDNELSYAYNGNYFTYKDEYEPIKQNEDTFLVHVYSPWKIYGNEAKRTVKTYNVPNKQYEAIISSDNIDAYLENLSYDLDNEYTYKINLKYQDKINEDTIYEIVKEVQDLTDYIDVVNTNKKDIIKIIIVILTELLILFSLRETSDHLIIEKILITIDKILKNNSLSKEQTKIIEELYDKYSEINKKMSTVKIRVR